ncbi:hypothetical protein RHGRI_023857 [Rhododendron griersonianum]|uniref:Endonuclease/exonuclease/phosphatase domain-containing protein n=1 Tax=Rhododendron griersonianum TaxID=479676 RepID=A0AAV6J4Y2_9ERIC|nr:hypothetical protein RHGRI_023857 [Rhododendron griersonianum]
MRIIGDGRAPPAAEHSASKRRNFSLLRPCHLHETSKKRRLLTETETLTLEPLTTHTPPLRTNYAASSHSSFRTHHKHKKHHRIKSSTAEGDRKWVYSTRSNPSHYKDKVVLVSYNILAVENASKHQDLYSKVPPKYLDWDRRKKLLCEEISRYSASILCFQASLSIFIIFSKKMASEVFTRLEQVKHVMAVLYSGKMSCKVSYYLWIPLQLLTFSNSYLKYRYTLLHQESIEFQMFGLRNNVAQLCVLKMTQDQSSSTLDAKASPACQSRSLLVGNIHVLFNPKRGDIKLGQIRLFLKKAHELSQEWGNIPVVLAGDFNSMPQSAMYQFLASAELDLQLHDRRNISGAICPLEYQPSQHQDNFWSSVSRPPIYRWSCEELCFATGTEGVTHLRHPLNLCSAYPGVHKWGSDHLALVCELAFADDVNEK